jgi:cadmium resistance protein CadD (predicted permease)
MRSSELRLATIPNKTTVGNGRAVRERLRRFRCSSVCAGDSPECASFQWIAWQRMDVAFEIAGVALTAFVSTNIDNLLLLTVLLGQPVQKKLAVFLGYLSAVLTVVAVGFGASRLADAVPSSALGYLGIVPLTMGLYRGIKLFGGNSGIESPVVTSALGTFGVAALTLANGADTLGVLLPLFAETADPWTYVLSATVLFAAALWFVLALWISRHPWIRANVARAERWLVPTLLIVVGSYILLNSTTDTVAGEVHWLDLIDANSMPGH